jgi:hypothetical protein
MHLEKATDDKYKWVAIFKNGKRTSFGAKGMDDYTLTHDKEQRARYRKRHEKDLDTNDPYRAGYLSYYLLWGESTSLATNVRSYNQRFRI